MTIKFQKFYVTNGAVKTKVSYSLDNRHDGKSCVTLYARDYAGTLAVIFKEEYKNDTDSHSDYFDKGRVSLFEDHPLYAAARERAEEVLNPAPKSCGNAKIEKFAAAVEKAELESLIRNKLDCASNRANCKTKIIPGKKYTKIDIGGSGRYMIDSDGNIFGIKGYGVPHFGHNYGTIDKPIVRPRF